MKIVHSLIHVMLYGGISLFALLGFDLKPAFRAGDLQSAPKLSPARTIDFANRTWFVRSGYGGPGPNHWSDSDSSVWVDDNGWLHLKIRKIGATWYSAEVYSAEFTRYGMHRFYLIKDNPFLDGMDKNIIAAVFLYQDDDHEIDIEFAKWGQTNPVHNAQYVIQPYANPGNLQAFTLDVNGSHTTHAFDWQPDRIQFSSLHGHYSFPPDPGYLINAWTYTGSDIPLESRNLRIHINHWLMQGLPPSNLQESEFILASIDHPQAARVYLPLILAEAAQQGSTR